MAYTKLATIVIDTTKNFVCVMAVNEGKSLTMKICTPTQDPDTSGYSNIFNTVSPGEQWVRQLTPGTYYAYIDGDKVDITVLQIDNTDNSHYCLLTTLDISTLTGLIGLDCSYNNLTSLDVSMCTGLTGLTCHHNNLTSLDVSMCTGLTGLACNHNNLTSLDISMCTGLTSLVCHGNQLTSLNVTGLTVLEILYCFDNLMTQAVVDAVIDNAYSTVPANTGVCAFNIGGTNSKPSEVGIVKIEVLRDAYGWEISYGSVSFISVGDPVIELIAKNLETAINAITVANGYKQTLKAVRPRRNDFSDITPDDLTVLIKQADEEQGQEPIGTQDWTQPFLLMAIVLDSDSATASIDTRINQVRADIQKKLLVDVTRGGNAYDTTILPSQEFDDGNGFSGIAVKIAVKYRTQYTNPYAKG